ncbi:Ribosome production factor 1 [Friedmanniomyces endolithicus]|uniref:Ribosome production factor 1 n=1 Tax=Rachicladosporium monterosium TaxID=1507873 RepID=A0ABR0LBL8_9PEZI|nr:Ribosome production factor 1 [Friedmanniomyces endolithicus]KAK5145955.1 Ribosome production factor 1 [Rachicladosporium monterosium]
MASFNPLKIGNKLKRQQQHQKVKKQKETTKRDDRFRRRRHEDKNPELREARLAKNVPATIDSKRTWDEANADEEAEGRLGLSVDVLHTKRRKVEDEEKQVPDEINPEDHVGDVVDDEEPAAVSGAEAGDDGELDELDSPMFHFSISNWVEGARLPGHGNPTNHYPELILNGFRTPLGLLAAHLFKSLFPPRPEIQGRQVITLHNQRDYIFFRRHRYVFRDKRGTEKSIQGTDGKLMKGVEEIRAGLQELGPRFTLKLRRVDKGIQWRSGQEWVWEAGAEKVRTRFSL